MLKTLLIFLSIFYTTLSFAQTRLYGRVVNVTGEYVEYFSIAILAPADSAYLAGGAFVNGEFNITSPKNDVLLRISSFDYADTTLSVHTNDTVINLGTMILGQRQITAKKVTVTANMVQSYGSKDVILIPQSIKEMASSGYDAIKQLPQFSENIMTNSLQTIDRQPIKILINSIEASERDLLSIPASEIIRVEYYTQPPARYANQGVTAVVNVITTMRTSKGGDVMFNTKNAVTTGYGTNIANLRFYDQNNQLDLRYFIDYRSLNDNQINQDFEYAVKGVQYKNTYEGNPGSYIGTYHIAQAKYLRQKKDNYIFSTNINYRRNPGCESYSQNTTVLMGDKPPVDGEATKNLKSGYDAFSADFYFNKQFKNNQEIVANVVGTYYDSYSNNHLTRTMQGGGGDYDYINDIQNQSWSVIGELMYRRKFKSVDFNVGARAFYKSLRQEYNDIGSSEMEQQVYYLYAGVSGTVKKFSYSIELGVEQNRNLLSGDAQTKSNFTVVKPSLSLSYNFDNKSSLRLSGNVQSNVPDISLLTTNPLYLNYNYISVGNPSLKPYYTIYGNLQYQLNVKNFYLSASARFNNAFDPYMPTFVDCGDMIVRTWDFKDNRYFVGGDLSMRWTPFKWLVLQPYVALGYVKIRNSDGTTMDHITKMLSMSVTFTVGKFSLLSQFGTAYSSLMGDYIQKNGAYYVGDLSYKYKSLTVAVQYIHNPYPMLTYTNNSVVKLSEETVWNNFRNMVVLRAVYHFSFGSRNSMQIQQRVSNADNDSGLRQDVTAK